MYSRQVWGHRSSETLNRMQGVIYMHGARMKYRIIRTYVKCTILMTVYMHGARIQAKPRTIWVPPRTIWVPPRSIWVRQFTHRQSICQTQSSSVQAVRKSFSRLKLGAQASRRAKKSAVQNPRVDAVKSFVLPIRRNRALSTSSCPNSARRNSKSYATFSNRFSDLFEGSHGEEGL